MRIAVSNLAWDVSSDQDVALLLNRYGIDAIDVAPGKYFTDIRSTSNADIIVVREWWADHGIEITGMQALLFGTTGLNLFSDGAVQGIMLQHLERICRIGSVLGATRLVFGSPKNRDRSNLDDLQVHDIALDFFHRLGDIACQNGVIICLEPNPPCYGANFMMNSADTVGIVMDVAHSSIRMQLDTGAMTINGEDAETIIKCYGSFIAHVHASEPDLAVLGDGITDHRRIANALHSFLPEQIVTIEMLPSKNEPHITAIERALLAAIRYYRVPKGENS